MKTVLKRALCGITAFVVAAGAMSYFPADTFAGIVCGVTAYAENETWRITITAADLKSISGKGSEKSPYEITTAAELLAVMEVRSPIYAILKNDIIINDSLLNRIDNESGKPSGTSDSIVCWPPIPDGWCINLDGNKKTIRGLYINESGKAGLCASLGVGSFKNLTITDSFVKGGDNVGVLNALDASAVLKSVIGISQGANPLMGDFNNDGTVNAIDASDILKWIIRS